MPFGTTDSPPCDRSLTWSACRSWVSPQARQYRPRAASTSARQAESLRLGGRCFIGCRVSGFDRSRQAAVFAGFDDRPDRFT
jgi:hypothetical protein